MVFSSLVFVFVFLPIVVITNYFLSPRFRNVWVLLASVFFYFWGEQQYIYVILISLLVNYLMAIWIDRTAAERWRRALLIVTVSANVGGLVYYKYIGFILQNLNRLGELTQIQFPVVEAHLPIGISFFTFHFLSYVIDVFRRRIPAVVNPIDIALYTFLFPHLIAGPIVVYADIQDQVRQRVIGVTQLTTGIERFVLGLAKKVIIANNVALVADAVFASQAGSLSMPIAWIGVIAYALQIYFDFSGYSDMAIGLAQMLGFKFIENFNYPYISKSIQEFWRRWNISLGNWFKSYVYIPLGGSRVSLPRILVNILIVFLLTGIWHGASWNFILWGLLNGFFLVCERLFLGKLLDRLPAIVSHGYVLLAVLVSWVFFRAESFTAAINYLKAMFGFSFQSSTGLTLDNLITTDRWLYLGLGVFFAMPVVNWISGKLHKQVGLPKSDQPLSQSAGHLDIDLTGIQSGAAALLILGGRRLVVLGLFALSVMYLITSTHNPFIYFRF